MAHNEQERESTDSHGFSNFEDWDFQLCAKLRMQLLIDIILPFEDEGYEKEISDDSLESIPVKKEPQSREQRLREQQALGVIQMLDENHQRFAQGIKDPKELYDKICARKPNLLNGLLIWKVSNASRLFGETAFFKKSFPGKRLSALRANRGRVPPPPSVPRVARRRTEGIRIQGIVDNPGNTYDGIVRVSQSDPAGDLAQGRKKRKRQEALQDGNGDEGNLPAFKIPRKPIDLPPRPSLAVTTTTTTKTAATPASLEPVFLTPVVPASSRRGESFDDIDNTTATTASQQQPTSPSSYLTPPVIVARAKNASKSPPSRRRRTLGF